MILYVLLLLILLLEIEINTSLGYILPLKSKWIVNSNNNYMNNNYMNNYYNTLLHSSGRSNDIDELINSNSNSNSNSKIKNSIQASLSDKKIVNNNNNDEDEILYDDDDLEKEAIKLAFNSEHDESLNKKVAALLEEEWDNEQGVTQPRKKPLPLKINLDLMTYNARKLALEGNFTGAFSLYRKCIEYNPVDGRAWLGLAKICWKRGDPDGAKKFYKDGLYYNRNSPYLLQGWAVMLEKQGELNQAIQLLLTSVKSNPKHAASWVALAKLRQRTGDYEEAKKCYTNAVTGDPKSYVALQAWGILEYQLKNIDQARELFRRAVEISPKASYALQAWATLERKEGNLDAAERLVVRAQNVYPESTRIQLTYAEICELRGETEKVRSIFIKGSKNAEKYGDAGFFQAWASFEIRELKELERIKAQILTNERREEILALINKLFKKAVSVNKFHSASWTAWAKHEQRLGNLDVARKLLITGISKFPNSRNIAWFHCSLGNIATEEGDINTARACYDRALASTPSQKSLNILLEYARMESLNGSTHNAMKLYETAVKRFPKESRVLDALLYFEKNYNNIDNTVYQKSNDIEKLKLFYNNTGSNTKTISNDVINSMNINKNKISSSNNDDSVNNYQKEKAEFNIDLEISRLRQTILGKATTTTTDDDGDIDNYMESIDLDFELGNNDSNIL